MIKNILTNNLKCKIMAYLFFGPRKQRCGRREVMGKRQQAVTVFVCLLFCVPQVALPESAPSTSSRVRGIHASDIFIPADSGYVMEVHPATSAEHPAIIVHIQEAHTNEEAQRHIIQILERLIQDHGLKLILVEGGDGDVGLSYLRRFGPPENRKQVAEKYLKAGVLSAEEYLDIVSDRSLILWGVEDQTLYDQNVEAFLAADALQESLRPVLASIRTAADSLKPTLLDPLLNELDAKGQAFERRELGLAAYAEALESAARRSGVPLTAHPNLAGFLEVRRLEQSVDLGEVTKEQQVLIGLLSERAPEADLEELVAKASSLKEGRIKPLEFYALLERLADRSKLDPSTHSALSRYVRYLTRSGEVDATALASELTAAAATIRAGLVVTPESRQLSGILEEITLVERLLELGLSPEEYQRLEEVDLTTLSSRWERFINEQLARQGLPAKSFQPLAQLQAKLPVLQRFYQSAKSRDGQLVANALAKLREAGEPLAVLITGGFHAPDITRLLREQGVGTVVVTPKVSSSTDERLYRAVVKYKSGHGSLDEVMAVQHAAARP